MSPCHPEAGYFRIKSQRLTVQKSVTYGAKVSHLRPVIPWLTNRNPIIKPLKIKQAWHLEMIPSKACKRAYKHQSKENLWKSMSNCEQVWATVSCLLTDFVSLHCDSEILGAPNQQNRRRPLMEQALQSASCKLQTINYKLSFLQAVPSCTTMAKTALMWFDSQPARH